MKFTEAGLDRLRNLMQSEGRVGLGFDATVADAMNVIEPLGFRADEVEITYTNNDDGVWLVARKES